MSSVNKKQNFSSEIARERTGRADNLFADALFPQFNQIHVQWKHCTSGWNHLGKLLLGRRAQLVSFFTPSIFSVSIQIYSVCFLSLQVLSNLWTVAGYRWNSWKPENSNKLFFSYPYIHPSVSVRCFLCNRIYVQAAWPAATAFS